jgi:hypothetical protein
MSKSPKDKAESIRHQLRNALRERGEDMQFGLQRYAIERFLYRFGVSPHRDRFILKGAALFALWGGAIYRPTRDLDFTGYGSSEEEDVVAALRDICRVSDTGDELVFDSSTLSAEAIRDDSEYHGLRIRLSAILGGSRIPIQIDIGFANAIEPPPQDAEYPTLLGDPPPRIRTYPAESVVAGGCLKKSKMIRATTRKKRSTCSGPSSNCTRTRSARRSASWSSTSPRKYKAKSEAKPSR